MYTQFFTHKPEWSKYFFITPGPLNSFDTNPNHFYVNLTTKSLTSKKYGKSYTFYIKYDEKNSTILYCGRAANAVGKSVLLKSEQCSKYKFFLTLKKIG